MRGSFFTLKTNLYTFFFTLLAAIMAIFGCSTNKPVAPVSEWIAKVWTASQVNQNTTTVYTKGGAANTVPGYSNFRLDLSNPTAVRYTEFDGSTFAGTWSVVSDNRLVLNSLTPTPTGTGGTIEFTIDVLNDTQLQLTRTTTSPKTGGTTNTYTLSNQ